MTTLLLSLVWLPSVLSIGCYVCKSGGPYSRDDRCESGHPSLPYANPCVPIGFPPHHIPVAIYCIKSNSTNYVLGSWSSPSGFSQPPTSYIIRGCAYGRLTGSKDTVDYIGTTVVHSCFDKDYCNGENTLIPNVWSLIPLVLTIMIQKLFWQLDSAWYFQSLFDNACRSTWLKLETCVMSCYISGYTCLLWHRRGQWV